MNLLTLEKINKQYSEKILLNDISLGVDSADKIGLIGINGTGKSSLLKIIAGRDEFFEGSVTKGKNIRIEYLEQNSTYEGDKTVIEQVFNAEIKEMKLLKEYEMMINANLKSKSSQSKLLSLQSEIDNLRLWDLESEAKIILNKLGIYEYDKKMNELSGGQVKRVFLAQTLITPSDILILDEPTNHLDSDTISWLEEYLSNYKGAIIMITHDRYFLDRVTNRILELDRGNLYSYQGNYSYFLEKKVERIENEKNQEIKRQSLIRNELKWIRRGAKARTTKQKARIQRFDELINKEFVDTANDIKLDVIDPRLGKKIIELREISKSYNEKKLFEKFSYIFTRGDRIGIIGKNGYGKTTLLKIIEGSESVDSGEISIGDTVKIGSFTQSGAELNGEMRVIDFVKEGGEYIPLSDGGKISASTLCERFLFDGQLQYTYINNLSGGEKRRLQLLRVLMSNPNVLILDEPTNDLDIETLKILEDFLDSFRGILLTVSHDRYFLDRVCNKIFSFEGNQKIEIYNGNYSDIKDKIILQSNENVKSENTRLVKEIKYSTKLKEEPKFSYNEKREYDNIEDDIMNLENMLEDIDKEIEEHYSDYSFLQELTEKKNNIEEKLLVKYERFEYLTNKSKEIEEFKRIKK
ncbi:MAG: ABC-F family ATP-binding cassette domain-containing protein [Clostridium sp.]|uniref:ABC-F family ATP-binding cassette domain-containing protein n=2 Tax=Clostridiaceae TaxID=31979 RepID=UPI0021521A9F|nr:ABC-F family ATP-binding cassette domain-containing protein [Clostridium sp. LY3-2]MCR6515761.1 ABC-F family ATP-binding cassette domain-containing protein [Clostridium sp. LY3-2]